MTKKEAALSYAKQGWKVFPCAPNTKVPLIAGGGGCKDATDNQSIISDWWDKNPDANIGLACGLCSGIAVVDVDVKINKGIDGFVSIHSAGLEITPTLSQNTPSGGRHFIYSLKGLEDVRNAQGLNGMLGVDVRGSGGYIVVAPSSIDGKQYSWIIDGNKIESFPDSFRPQKRDGSVFDIETVKTESSPEIRSRALAYIAEIPGAIEHVDGHNKLFWVAQVLVNGFRMTDDDALDIMWSEYNPRCCPPWDRNGKTEREFKHKISEARKNPNPEACAIFNSTLSSIDEEFDFDACIADVRSLVYPECKTHSETIPIVTKQDAMREDLFVPEGLVGDIARWMNDTAFCQQPLLSLGASLTLCGAIMGRKVCDESNGRTNIYCMGIGPSSSGKDHPGDCINQILSSAGAESILMGRMTSDTAIEKALSTYPHCKLAVMDEVGHFFSNINRAGDNSTYLKTIKPTLMELFSSAHKTYIGKEKAQGAAPHISQPCMCIWGVTVPEKLYSGMTLEELQDGWIARNLIFIAPDKIPPIVMKPHSDVPEAITNQVRAWFMRSSCNGGVLITSDSGGGNKPLVVQMDERAKKRFDAFNDKTRDMLRDSHKFGEKTQYLWGKCLQNARRIALIVACGKEFETPSIGYYEADYGCRLVEFLVRNAIEAIDGNVSNNNWEADKLKILSIIRSYGIKGCVKRDIVRKTQYMKDKRTRDAYIEDLVNGGYIVCDFIPNTHGKPKVIFRTVENCKKAEEMEGINHVDADE